MKSNIDIVFPWVDGSDPEWQRCKQQFQNSETGDQSAQRFRNWELLKYTFRGIEKNTPWVRKVHFITWGHLPEWINTDCPKLNIVKHEDYIPSEYLPTFNSHTIELNLHRIKELSDYFVYMNDDMYFIRPLDPEDFFQNNIPRSSAGLNVINEYDPVFAGILQSDKTVINNHFFSGDIIKDPKKMLKFLSFKNEIKTNFKTLCLLPWCVGLFPGFNYFHGPNAYLKSTFKEVWAAEHEKLNETCLHKFRQFTDVNQYLMLWWQWCEGNFTPISEKGRLNLLNVHNDINKICSVIENQNASMICINDSEINDFEEKKRRIINSFESILGEKSMFEK